MIRTVPVTAAAMLALLSACGQKGPLYLPDDSPTAVIRPAPGTPADDRKDDGKKDETKETRPPTPR